MSQAEFIDYVGIADIHDGTVVRVSVEGKTVQVVIKGFSGREHTLLFDGVDEVEMNEPEDMLLYAISEVRAKSPLRRFVFLNSSEDDPKSLSIVALDFQISSN